MGFGKLGRTVERRDRLDFVQFGWVIPWFSDAHWKYTVCCISSSCRVKASSDVHLHQSVRNTSRFRVYSITTMNSMHGELFMYDNEKRLVGFLSRANDSTQCSNIAQQFVIFIGGLSDGFLPLEYSSKLCKSLNEKNVHFISVLLSSSYTGYGLSSISQDVNELNLMLNYVYTHFTSNNQQKPKVILFGHSTGCQDIIAFLHSNTEISGCILQGPVSDREYLATFASTKSKIQLAQSLVSQGKSKHILPWNPDAEDGLAPITASRYLSLALKSNPPGEDDMFSTDLSQHELLQIVQHLKQIPTLLVFSENDEYVPTNIDWRTFATRLHSAMGTDTTQLLILNQANHAVSFPMHAQSQLISKSVDFIQESFSDH
uniref:Uncharacterized protein n=1 Tax=Timspurckia oligopyrenoides TaxID=708627 RepID=A0A7S1ER86_9RHOD|mmetsp:Transcript_13635/g.24454  ORF Transcript_13635/g.24454 Transcript_13635/m.24454 type:complete len:373 (+) Transcript_13635:34-1152(+)